jgi:hypothetical protein
VPGGLLGGGLQGGGFPGGFGGGGNGFFAGGGVGGGGFGGGGFGGGTGGSLPSWPGCGAPPGGSSGTGGASGSQPLGGAFAGGGLPPTLIPSPSAIASKFQLQGGTTDPNYVYTASQQGGLVTGSFTVTVRFQVDGQPSLVPMSLAGNVTVTWTTQGAGSIGGTATWSQSGSWSLAIDGSTGVQTLTGSESYTDPLVSASSSATGFVLPTATSWPSGVLSSSFRFLNGLVDEQVTQTFDGTKVVVVQGKHAGSAFGPDRIDLTTGKKVP